MSDARHLPVLLAEVRAGLHPQPGEIWVDVTLGAGGHTRMIAEAVGDTGRVYALDQDQVMIDRTLPTLVGLPVTCAQANFDQLGAMLDQWGIDQVDGVLADLGICSDQLDDPQRGLSFQHDGPLDMRLDPSHGESAADMLARISESALADLIYEYGEERMSRRIAKRIVETRQQQPITTTTALARLVRSCVPRTPGSRIDPATRTFQALRIAVNDELGTLDALLGLLPRRVKAGGRVGIISFHSLEDRRVKQAFRREEYWDTKRRKPIEASTDEAGRNPRSRSAKLRIATRQPNG